MCIPEAFDRAHDAEWADLGAGTGFGSQVQLGREFQFSDVAQIDEELAARIAAFDWWIHNGDRSLTPLGGNPNLLWCTFEDGAGLVMIDHNLAFRPDFSARDLLQTHVFANQFKYWLADFIAPEQMRQEFMRARGVLARVWGTIPEAWRFVDPECTIRAGWSPTDFESVLARCEHDDFWQP